MSEESGTARYDALPADVRALYPWPGRNHTLTSGHTMHFVDEGSGEGSPMLMVHGNPTWSFYYRELVKAFAGSHRCVVPDHIGSGLSDKPQRWSYRLQDHIDNLVELIDALELSNITVVVHDWGGPIGLGAAAARRDRIGRLVVFNTSVFMEEVPLSIRACRLPGFGDLVVKGFNAAIRGAMARSLTDRGRMSRAVARGYAAPYPRWADRVGHMGFFRDIPLEPRHPTRATIARLTAEVPEAFADTPTTFLWGDQDFVFTPRFLERWLELLPHAQSHRFPDAAHWVVEDAHERIVPLMQDFVDRTDG